jgi:hypothetical protein
MTTKLSAKDQKFADLYNGGPDDQRGNATSCYRYLHPRAKDNTCQVEGSKLLSKPMVAEYLQSKREELTEATGINAEYVLRQSIRYLEIAFGDKPAPKNFNSSAVKGALDLIGRHTRVQAFQITVEHSHTHKLEQRLAARSKVIEGKALRLENKSVISAGETLALMTADMMEAK